MPTGLAKATAFHWSGHANLIGEGVGSWKVDIAFPTKSTKSRSNPDLTLRGDPLRHGVRKYGKYIGFQRLDPLLDDRERKTYQRIQIRYFATARYKGTPTRFRDALVLFISDPGSANELEEALSAADRRLAKTKAREKGA